jgi:hypothetical protein
MFQHFRCPLPTTAQEGDAEQLKTGYTTVKSDGKQFIAVGTSQ